MTSAAPFKKSSGWLDWHPDPGTPSYRPPAGAVDAHCHVFGPGAAFPYAAQRKYTPCDASKEQLFALRDHLGFTRNVIVQASCHGTDNRALLDALDAANGRARGVAAVRPDIDDQALQALARRGVKALRFNFVKRLVAPPPRAPLAALAHRLARYGLHIVIYFEAADLPELSDFIRRLPVTVVVDHMGRPDLTRDPEGPEFAAFQRLLDDNPHVWTKVTCAERLSVCGPPHYEDFTPFARRLVRAYPERVLWGTDWPHPNMHSHMPDDAWLVDLIPRIATDARARRLLLVDNPLRLYWPEEVNRGA